MLIDKVSLFLLYNWTQAFITGLYEFLSAITELLTFDSLDVVELEVPLDLSNIAKSERRMRFQLAISREPDILSSSTCSISFTQQKLLLMFDNLE